MTGPREPEDYGFKPPMTARRETKPTSTVERLVSRATLSMPPRARARHFSSKGSVPRVRPVRSEAGGMRRVMVKVRVVPMTPGAKMALMTHVHYAATILVRNSSRRRPGGRTYARAHHDLLMRDSAADSAS